MIGKKLNLINILKKTVLTTNIKDFSTEKKDPTKPPLIKVSVQVDQQTRQFAFPLHTKLAKNLQDVGIPLQFACGYSCSCGTCACTFQPKDYQKITSDQPIGETEKAVLIQNSYGENVRLTCQLFIMQYFKDMKIKASV